MPESELRWLPGRGLVPLEGERPHRAALRGARLLPSFLLSAAAPARHPVRAGPAVRQHLQHRLARRRQRPGHGMRRLPERNVFPDAFTLRTLPCRLA